MSQFKICINSTADLPSEYIKINQLGVLHLTCNFEGITYGKDKELDSKLFYERMRAGSLPTTSQVNPTEAKEYFEECLKSDKEILAIAFSSGLSGTYNSMKIAADEILEERDDCKIIVIDSKCASLGEGLLIHKAIQLKKEGKSLEETAEWVENNKLHLVHVFTVDDLNHLYRGGRVSKMAAIVGTMINIKPILHVDNSGHLIPLFKLRGRKKSLHALVDYMEEKMGSFKDQNDIFFISHGDCIEEAEYVATEVKNRFGIENYIINNVGTVIGAHSGPGTMALFFMGDIR